MAVSWYLRFSLSYRDVEELLLERGMSADHVTHWVVRRAKSRLPRLLERLRKRERTDGFRRKLTRPRQVREGLLRPETYRDFGGAFRFRYTLHLPSIKASLETNHRFVGVFHTLNQRHAQLCY